MDLPMNEPHLARGVEAGIETDLRGKLDYAGYLHLDLLLAAQKPLSQPEDHNETLFIIQHQTSELWLKLMIHELHAALQLIQNDALEPCFKILARVKQVQRVLFEQWAVLETLTPNEYIQFRNVFGPASGFQSYQYREIEFLFGNKDADTIEVFSHDPTHYAILEKALNQPSIYDLFLQYLHRHGFALDEEVIHRDWSLPYQINSTVMEAFQEIYSNPTIHWREYEMAEKLVDVDEAMALWRFRHMKTVERIIGMKRGTGGSSGVSFLKQVVDIHLFPELWAIRTEIRKD